MISLVEQERPQHARDQRERRAAGGAGDHHRRDRRRRRVSAEREPGRGAADRADVELALAADVEEVHPEGDRGAEPGEDQRRRRDERRVERVAAAKASRRAAR